MLDPRDEADARAAERATATPGLPDAARDALVGGNTALADAIDAPEEAA